MERAMTTSPKTATKGRSLLDKPGTPADVASAGDMSNAKQRASKAKAKKPKSKAEMRKATAKGNAKKGR